ncbi:hypothetical protein, partial [Armatimonas sp.]|uniref:hypothetical protein n=1 Tax=Armatimonas sp. TaxID=1872638 RepID=UPI00375123DD
PNVPWSGKVTSGALTGSEVTLTIDSSGTDGTLAIGNQFNQPVTLTSNFGMVTISNANVSITGFPEMGSSSVEINQATLNMGASSGTLYLLRANSQGLVVPDLADANRASLEILPPDFFGEFLSISGRGGRLGFQHDIPAPSRELPRFNLITGQLAFNDMVVSTVMTFAPTPDRDGSFRFDLVGDTGHSGGLLLVMRGSFLPGVERVSLGTMRGTYKLLAPRNVLTDSGRFAMTQVA